MVSEEVRPYLWLAIVAAAISATIALLAWRRRQALPAVALLVLMLAVTEWSLAYAIELGSADLSAKLFWANVEWLGIVVVPAAWLAFVLAYTGRERWLTRRKMGLLAVEPLVTLALLWSNDMHGLVRAEVGLTARGPLTVLETTYGPWFWVHATYSYLLLFTGSLYLVRSLVRSPAFYRSQGLALLVAASAPWIANALYLLRRSPVPGLDLTPFAFVLSGIALAWAFFRFRLLDILPAARDSVLESMRDAVIVLDAQDRLVDLNPAARRLLHRSGDESIGQAAGDAFAPLPGLIAFLRNPLDTPTELAVLNGDGQRLYEGRLSALYDGAGRLTGRLALLHDITERKQAEQSLQHYADRLQVLSRRVVEVQEAERKRVAADLHDSALQWLSSTVFRVEVVRRLLESGEMESAHSELGEIERALQRTIRELRTNIVRLHPIELKRRGLVQGLAHHIGQWSERSGVDGTLRIEGEYFPLPTAVETGLYRICQEALNNVAKHARADRVVVTLAFEPDDITLTVRDDGVGIPPRHLHTAGGVLWYAEDGDAPEAHVGLLDMGERAQLLGGRLDLQSKVGGGTTITVTIPLQDD